MKVVAEYIWLDGKNTVRSKIRIIDIGNKNAAKLSDIPKWNYDGSSTYQAFTSNSEIFLNPVKIYENPMLSEKIGNFKCYIVLCKTSSNDCTIAIAENIFSQDENNEKPMFGLEQEFFIIDTKTLKPLGWPLKGEPYPQGDYYCSVGSDLAFGREYLEECMKILLEMGVAVTGMNYEVAPGQAEFQVCDYGIDAAHGIIVLRYVLSKLGEKYGYIIDLSPKPIEGNWNGSGCHVNFSTKSTRKKGGYNIIHEYLSRLEATHTDDIKLYGEGNEKRLTGKHETSSMEEFTYGIADRSASVRIPTETYSNRRGYIEDRRPASNIDPYVVTSNMFKVCCLDGISLAKILSV